VLLPKAMVDQGLAVAFSFGLSTLVYAASIPGKAFTGFLMEIMEWCAIRAHTRAREQRTKLMN